jgi:hypothetical protein
MDVWSWLERLSWLVALLGFPTILYQIVAARRELMRRPSIKVGFQPQDGKFTSSPPQNVEFDVKWDRDEPLSQPLVLTVAGVNVGKRTARNLVWNIDLGPAGIHASPVSKEGFEIRMAADGRLQVRATTLYIHPGIAQTIKLPVQITRTTGDVHLEGTVNMEDFPEVSFTLIGAVRPEKG